MSGESGVEIPKGDPDALRGAGGAWDGLAALLEHHGGTVRGAEGTVAGADWNGPASTSYLTTSWAIGAELDGLVAGLGEAADAARAFARTLETSQRRAKRARRQAIDALDVIETAKRQLADASERVLSAQSRASTASDAMFRAGAAGPAGEPMRAVAQADHDAAVRDGADAAGDVRRAQDALDAGERELREARRDGREANDDAEDAARTASGAFSAAAGNARPPSVQIAPVPISLRGASPELAGLGAGAIGGAGAKPSWLSGPGRFATPAQARAAQIARLKAEARDAAAQERPPLNPLQKLGAGMMTAGASIVDVPTFGYTSKALEWAAGDDRAVDQDASFYKGAHKVTEIGEMLTMVGIVRHGGKKAVEEFLEHATKKADDAPRTYPTHSGHGGGPNPYPHLAPGERWKPDDGIPVLGRLPDTAVAKDWPGHAVLQLPKWDLEKNREWIQSIADQRAPVYVGSRIEGNMVNKLGEPTVFKQEIDWLIDAGYRPEGDFMVPGP
jgi:hypothetical protein